MKYQTPEMTVLVLEIEDVLTASLTSVDGGDPAANVDYNDQTIWF